MDERRKGRASHAVRESPSPRPRQKAREADGLARLAAITQRLAVLLAAGVAPDSAWVHLDHTVGGGAPSLLSAVARRPSGVGVSETIVDAVESRAALGARAPALADTAWRGLAAAWLLASEVGAPLAPTLLSVSSSLQDLASTQRELQVALEAPRSTARLVMALPIVGVLFGLALGFDTVGILFTTVPGGLCLLLGAALMVIGWRWNLRLVRGATPADPAPGLELDLLAIAVSGGAALDRARRAVTEVLQRCGLQTGEGGGAVNEVLELSRRAGVPAAALLRGEAGQARASACSAAQEAAARLSVTLMMPLGLCVLPAFLLLGVAPLMIAVLSSTVTGV